MIFFLNEKADFLDYLPTGTFKTFTIEIEHKSFILLEFAVIAARQSWFPNFRGTWLNNDTFLNADVLAYFFSNDNIKLVACTVSLWTKIKVLFIEKLSSTVFVNNQQFL